MDEYLTQDELKEWYDSLPEDIQDVLFSPETADVYDQIRERYGLDASQREELSMQTGLLMMGITDPKDYVLQLAEALGIQRDKAAFIAQEVNRSILHTVRESLKEVHGLTLGQTSAPISGVVETATSARVFAPTLSAIPTPKPPVEQTALEQKLGDSFRVPPQAPVPDYSTPLSPRSTSVEEVPPLPPLSPLPTVGIPAPTTPPVPTGAPQASDPYRESV